MGSPAWPDPSAPGYIPPAEDPFGGPFLPNYPPYQPINIIQDVTLLVTVLASGVSAADLQTVADDLSKTKSTLQKAIDKLTRFTWVGLYAFGATQTALSKIWALFTASLWLLVKSIAGLLRVVLRDILGGLLKLLKLLWQKVIPKILEIIGKLRKWLQVIYAKYIRPLLNYIQIVRRYLAILRLFHVKWAAKLDGYLQKLETRIIGPYLYVLRTLNGIGSWVNVLVTVKGVIQRAVFVNTMFAYQADWVNMWWWGQSSAQLGGTTPAPVAPTGPPTNAEVQADLMLYAQTQTGPAAAWGDSAQAAFDQLQSAA